MIRSRRHNLKWPTGGQIGKLTFPVGRSPTLQRGVQNENGPTSGQFSYPAPSVGGVRDASKGGTKSDLAHQSWDWLRYLACLGSPPLFKVRGQNEHWPTRGQIGDKTNAVWGVPNALERGTKSTLAHMLADLLHNLSHVAASRRLHRGGTKSKLPQKWSFGLHNQTTNAPWDVANTSRRGTKSTLAHK